MASLSDLIPDVVTEILLRLPSDDPACLVRASAVCKPWLRILTDPAFLRRYRTFHGTPRVLGFLHEPTDLSHERYIPTTAFRPQGAAAAHRSCAVLDCRHGRALLYDSDTAELVVWDPVTGQERRIPDDLSRLYSNNAVLCAAAGAGCDHTTCSGGPFLLASVAMFREAEAVQQQYVVDVGFRYFAYGCFYSSETGDRSAQSELYLGEDEHNQCNLEDRPSTFAGGALYFLGDSGGMLTLLRYDVLGGRGLSAMELPAVANFLGSTFIVTASNGRLGLAAFHDGILTLWSTETGPNGDATWVFTNFIRLGNMLPVDIPMSTAWLSGFAEDTNLIFLSTDDNGIFTIEPKSLLTKKFCEMGNVKRVIPYMSFYTPAAFAKGTLQSPMETQ